MKKEDLENALRTISAYNREFLKNCSEFYITPKADDTKEKWQDLSGFIAPTKQEVTVSVINDGPTHEIKEARFSDTPEGFFLMAVEHGEKDPRECSLHVEYFYMYGPHWVRA